jgi:septum formation protein
MYLASKSPQRKVLLESLGIEFEVVPPDYLEENTDDNLPAEQVERHSRGKAFSILSKVEPMPSSKPIIVVDTMVVIHGQAVGKAEDEEEALVFLRRMSGRTHLVYSGLTLLWSGSGPGERVEATAHAVTEVRFSVLSDREMESYVGTGEWRERAGAYAIQGRASAFVDEIRGDYTNVVGLPVPLLVSILRGKGQWPPAGWLSP